MCNLALKIGPNFEHNSLAEDEVALKRRNRTCKTGLQYAIFEIQAHRGCSKGPNGQLDKILVKLISYVLK